MGRYLRYTSFICYFRVLLYKKVGKEVIYMGKYDEWTCKKLTWTKELCIKLINDVKNHGSAEVARELGYKDSTSLRAILRTYSKRFGVIDIYDEMIGRKGKGSNHKVP